MHYNHCKLRIWKHKITIYSRIMFNYKYIYNTFWRSSLSLYWSRTLVVMISRFPTLSEEDFAGFMTGGDYSVGSLWLLLGVYLSWISRMKTTSTILLQHRSITNISRSCKHFVLLRVSKPHLLRRSLAIACHATGIVNILYFLNVTFWLNRFKQIKCKIESSEIRNYLRSSN